MHLGVRGKSINTDTGHARRTMKMWQRLSGVLGALVLCAVCAADPLMFTATGDGPRTEADWMLFARQIAQDNVDGKTTFLLHLGDIWKGTERLPESHYLNVATLLRTSVAPVYIVPGDNEWTDLLDPAEGWAFWSNHLLKLDEHWKKDAPVARQPDHEENMAWAQQGVLMIGINMVGGEVKDPAAWNARHVIAAAWAVEQLKARGASARAAVIFGQAKPKPHHEDFFAPVIEAAKAFARPVMYLHGDGHKYEVEPNWRAANITRVQVDQVEKARPLLITVTDDPAQPFHFDRRL
jgi:hypothetical protein